MPNQLTSPSVEASPRCTPCDVPYSVRRVPAQWVRPRRPRLAMLVSWTGRVPANLARNSWNGTSGLEE